MFLPISFALIWGIGILTLGLLMMAFPQWSVSMEAQILRTLRLRSKKTFARPLTRRRLHLERAAGFALAGLAFLSLAPLRVALSRNSHAAEVSSPELRTATPGLETLVSDAAEEFMDRHKPVGLAIGVVDRQTSFILTFGEVKLGSNETPTSRTLFEIGSITKTFTGVVLAGLVRRGELSLEQPVEELLPGSVRIPSLGGRRITLGDLAAHRSGLPRLPDNLVSIPRLLRPGFLDNPYRAYGPDDLHRFLEHHQLTRPPGETFEYSNLGAGLLGYALASHTSSTCEALYRTHICAPLGLRDTAITLSPDQEGRLAVGYSERKDFGPFRILRKAQNWTFQEPMAGGGALRSTPSDMVRYLEANLGLTSSPLNATLEFAQLPRYPADSTTSIGLAWITSADKEISGGVTCHDGGTGGYTSLIAFSRREQCGVVILCNTSQQEINRLGLSILRALIRARQHPGT